MSYINQTSITQLTTAGNSNWVSINSHTQQVDLQITTDTASSLVVRVEFDSDRTGAVQSRTVDYTLPNGSNTVTLSIPSTYTNARLVWVSGTATSVDATFRFSF